MKKYKQLNLHQRYQIQALLKTGCSKSEIARILDLNLATDYREIKGNPAKRGRIVGEYVVANAQRRMLMRHKSKPKQVLLTDPMKERIAGLLRFEQWSPELISERLSIEVEACVSHETIYQWIWKVKKAGNGLTLPISGSSRTSDMGIEDGNGET